MTRLAMMAACGLGLLTGVAFAEPAATPERPMNSSPPSLGGRHFPSGEVERQVRPQGDSAEAERDRRHRRELNELSRQLTPPGTPVPAPHVETRRPSAP